jgi:YYY domain-containing protein
MKRNLLFASLIIVILLGAGYLRISGINWDTGQHLHPDERFLTDVLTRISSVENLAEYFDTGRSSLNPNNHGINFFVYGSLPIFAVRYAAEWSGITGFDQIQLVGRALSALADLGVVFLVYLMAAKLFDRRVGILAAAFSAVTVIQIQQSHFFTVDNFTNFFTYLAIFFALRIAVAPRAKAGESVDKGPKIVDFLLFGVALGLAVASKVSVAPLALILPLALSLRLLKLDSDQRIYWISKSLWYLILAGVGSFVVFRIFQPYAFAGPSFFNFNLNPLWVDTMSSLRAQVTGDFDWPPSMQWARRPVWFAFQHLTLWGMGLPMSIAAWSGFAWAGWRLFKSKWQRPELVLWGWGAAYFVWQSLAFNPTMRYLLPVYPALAIFAALVLIRLWDGDVVDFGGAERWRKYVRPMASVLAGVVLAASAVWAIAFSNVYTSPITRIEATDWIYQNIPGPITLSIESNGDVFYQPLSVPNSFLVKDGRPFFSSLRAGSAGSLAEISLHHIVAPVLLEISSGVGENELLVLSESQVVDLLDVEVGSVEELLFPLPVGLIGQQKLTLSLPAGEGQLVIEQVEIGQSQNPEVGSRALIGETEEISLGESWSIDFLLDGTVPVDQLRILLRVQSPLKLSPIDLRLVLSATPDMAQVLAVSRLSVLPNTQSGGLVEVSTFSLDRPIELEQGQELYLQVQNPSEGAISLLGSALVNETSWDDGLPLRLGGYDGFGGIYQGDLNFEIYWDEDEAKVERFLDNLDGGEYLFISSSRQWASLPRIPERFPLASAYYRLLLGCPDHLSVEACFNSAQVGSFEGQLGYELKLVFDSSPQLGSLIINDQAAEEAFTVYDHPKVFIFEKSANYDQEQVAALLSAVDLSKVERVTPKQAEGRISQTLMLPEIRWEEQRSGGSWSEIFDSENWVNASPWISLVVWYLSLGLLGIAVFPLLRIALPGLDDEAYPFARLAGLLLLSYIAWLGASLGISFSRGWLWIFAFLLILAGAAVAYRQRAELQELWKSKRHYFYRTELIFLGFFLVMLLIRWGNPDLWHPSKGGEKPMDFSYFNAVLKSSSFPPYDPWFAGGYINYYYYGFVLVGSLTKLLGIVPSVAYNLILPTLFAMLALGAYSIGWNLFSAWRGRSESAFKMLAKGPSLAGIGAAIGVVLLGNLASLQMIFSGYQKLGNIEGSGADPGLITQIVWTLRGFWMNLLGTPLPFGLSNWYWNPTRIITAPDESTPITEFPLFTFTYADLHAHMIALPLTMLALAWALSVVLSRAWEGGRSPGRLGWSFVFGGIVIGSLRPTNTWDFPTFLMIGVLAVAYAIWRYWPRGGEKFDWVSALLRVVGGAGLIALLSFLSFKPYADWYQQGFTSMKIWEGSHTPSGEYLLHWGAFLFFIVAWMAWETRQWLASIPLSSLRKLQPYRLVAFVGLFFLVVTMSGLYVLGVNVVWLLPLMLWAAFLIFRPEQSEAKRLTLFLIGTGLFLSLMVEVIVLSGDISRMNTVFKFYMQVWSLFALSAALSLAWIVSDLREWSPNWRRWWQVSGAAIIASAGLFLLLGVSAKIQDRMADDAPAGLDGMSYMQYAVYHDKDQEMFLNQDYEAIRWLQENVEGSPVIMEAQTGEYRWGARITINTGLPTVLGWNWHQRQQREFVAGNDIWGRAADVTQFYETEDLNLATDFLDKYQVKYIVVGQLERAYYVGAGLEKFEQQEGLLWREVFRFEDTIIYEVIDEALASN